MLLRLTNKYDICGQSNEIGISHHSLVKNCLFSVHGNENIIKIADGCKFENVRFILKGNRQSIQVGSNVAMGAGSVLWIEDNEGLIQIGKYSTFEQVHLAVTEDKSSIIIGEDCMFSNDIDVRTGDSHSIFDLQTGKRINAAKSVIIGNHVWCGAHVSILKGSQVPNGCVIGARSTITCRTPPYSPNIIIAGTPADEIRKSIKWSRER